MLKLRLPRGFYFPWLTTSLIVLCIWLTGQCLKDRTWICGLMFYLPSPVVSTWLIFATWRSWHQQRYARSRRALLAMTVLPLWFVVVVENQWRVSTRSPDEAKQVMRLVHWNVGWPARTWPAQREVLRELNADFYLLSEISDAVQDQDFEGFNILRRQHMLLACRGKMTASGSLVRYGVIQAFLVRCELESCVVNIMIADVASPPSLPRNPYLQPMMQAARDRQADIVVGDMNAPRRSLAFSDMSDGFRHAYDVAGAGWSYTWPVPLPVLAIDQCICGPRIDVLDYHLRTTLLSDHRLQVVDFALIDDL